jgi:hypothetical protein
MTNTLITWACGHFCAGQSTLCMSRKDIIEAATNDYWFLLDTAEEDLANIATDRHVPSSKTCPNCQEPVGVSIWRTRANEAVRVLRHLHAGSKQMYLETGAQYWGLDFSQKAKHANDPRCAAAHEQFWISKTRRLEDLKTRRPVLHSRR